MEYFEDSNPSANAEIGCKMPFLDRRSLIGPPPVLPNQFHKPAPSQVGLVDSMLVPDQFDQILGMLIAHGNDHAAAERQLVDQCGWKFRSACGDDNGVERALVLPTGGAVRIACDDIVIPQVVEQFAGFDVKRVDPLDGVDPIYDLSQNRRLIS
jgi:hypothetical protein